MYRTLLSLTLFTLLLLGTSPAVGQTTHTVSPGESIQAAIDGASNGDTIEVEDGTFSEDVTINKELTVNGPNAGTPGADSRAAEARIKGQVVLSADGAIFDGFEVSPPDVPNDTGKAEAIRISNTPNNVTVQNNIVRDFTDQVSATDWFDITGINVFGGDSSTPIENSTVSNNLVEQVARDQGGAGAVGISIQGNVSNATVTDNVIRDIGLERSAYGFGIVVRGTGNHSEVPSGVDVENNTIENLLADPASAFRGVGLGLEVGDAGDATFQDNTVANAQFLFEDKTNTVGLEGIISSNDFDVAILTDDSSLSQAVIFGVLQDAIDASEPAASLSVYEGTYDESITIDKALAIQAAAGVSSKPVIVGQSTNAVDINASDVTISGLDIQNPQGGGAAPTARNAVGIRVLPNSTGVTISDNHIQNIATGVETNPLGIVAFDGANNLTIQNNTLQNLEGTDADEGQAQAILLIQESTSNPTAITGALIKGNTITNVSDTRSAVAIRFNGDVRGTIEDNTISKLFTDGPAGTGFTQAIAFAKGGNGSSAPSSVTITGNTISELEDNGTDNFVGASHIIFTNDVDESTVTITDNTFNSSTPDEGYVVDATDDKDFDLSSILTVNGNTYDLPGEIIFGAGGGAFNLIVPERPATLVRAPDGDKPAAGEKLFVASGTSQRGNFKSYLDDIDGFAGNRVTGETLGTPWWLDTDRSWQVDWDASAEEVTFTLFSDDMWSTQADQISSTFTFKTFNGDAFDFAGLSIGARTTNDDDTVTYSAVQFDDGNGFKAVPEANASYNGNQFSHNFFAFAETFDAKTSDFSLRGQMRIEGELTSSDNPRFDIKAVQVPPPAECVPPELVENRDGIPDGFITVTAEDQEGVVEVGFVDEDGNPALTNFEASTESGDFETLDDGITFTLKDGATAPNSVEFKLTAVPPEGTEPGEDFTAGYFVEVENGCGSTILNDPIHTLSNSPANELAISGNYPNPFVASTTVEFGLPEAADVRLVVYDVMGRQIATLVDGPMQAGTHEAMWDGTVQNGSVAASGVYILRLQVGDQQTIHRITRVR
jgi:hypothetical protein